MLVGGLLLKFSSVEDSTVADGFSGSVSVVTRMEYTLT